jgi:hypothetical protein
VTFGRRSLALVAAAALVLAGMLAVAGTAEAGNFKKRFLKSLVFSDGTMTVGKEETISVLHMPPGAPMKVLIEPVSITPQCGNGPYFCDPELAFPPAGGPPFIADANGSAILTFVMPTSFLLEDVFNPANSKRANFVQGQPIHIDVIGKRKIKGVKKLGFGFARAGVQGPPPG